MLGLALVTLPVLGIIDASSRPDHHWAEAGRNKRRWIGWQAAGAPFGVGFVAAVAYFFRARPQLVESSRPPALG